MRLFEMRRKCAWFVAMALMTFAIGSPSLAYAANPHAVLSASTQPSADGNELDLQLRIDPGFHAQSHTPLDENLIPLAVTVTASTGVSVGSVDYPAGTIEDYPALGKVSVYTGAVTIKLPYHVIDPAAATTLTGTVRFQACNETSCFQPQKLPFSVVIGNANIPNTTQASTTNPTMSSPTTTASAKPTATPRLFGHDLKHDAYLFVFAVAFLVGIIFNVMPCVLPVVPLKIMGFYEVSQHDRRKSIALGAVFSAGLIASFAVLGVLIFVLHAIDWGGLFQQKWFTAIIVTVLAVMSFSMFGAFSVGLPSVIYRVTPRHDTYTGNFLFGVLTAALSTPCTFGMFVLVLAWALSQPAAVGVALIMTVGVGMAFPYFVLSAFPQVARNFPRTGAWADVVKQMMGFLLLVAAVYFAQTLLDQYVSYDAFWWAMFGVIAIGSIFLVVRAVQITEKLPPRAVAFTLAIVAIGVSLWGAIRVTSRPFEWQPYSADSVAAARASGRPVLIDFTASWCGNCHYIEAFVLKNKRIVAAVRDRQVVMIQADVSNEHSPASPLLDQLNPANSIPLTAVYLPNATEAKTLDGIYSADDLLNLLKS